MEYIGIKFISAIPMTAKSIKDLAWHCKFRGY